MYRNANAVEKDRTNEALRTLTELKKGNYELAKINTTDVFKKIRTMFNNNRLYEIFQFVDTTISMNADDEHLTSAYDNLKILLDPEKYTNLNEKELMFTYYDYGLKFCFEELKILNADHKLNLLQHKKRKRKVKQFQKQNQELIRKVHGN